LPGKDFPSQSPHFAGTPGNTYNMSDALLRQWAMLRLIPKHPRKIDTGTLARRLAAEGYSINRRTIQRDLLTLSEVFPLAVDDRDKPFGWFWMKEAAVMDIPGMEAPTALAFQLAHTYLTNLLPPAALSHLKPHFKRAGAILNHTKSSGLRLWPDKVRIIGRGPNLIPPKVSPNVHDAVCQALLDDTRITVRYRGRGAPKASVYEVNPLGLVFRQGVVYLICTLWDYEDIKQLALHRLSCVELLDRASHRPTGFSLDTYINSGEFGYPVSQQKIKLRALFDSGAAFHLYETPISTDQRLIEKSDGNILLEARVLDTSELRWWLLGFGDGVEVLGPKRLREEFRAVVCKLSQKYSPK